MGKPQEEKKIVYAFRLLKHEGLLALLIRSLQKLQKMQHQRTGKMNKKKQIHTLVKYKDALSVDWSSPPKYISNPNPNTKGSYLVSWIMSPPGESSGGHQNIFRFINYLEKSGHTVKIYLYSSQVVLPNLNTIQAMLSNSVSYPDVKAEIFHYTEGVDKKSDAIFATGWETAYPAYLDKSQARRFYFVQDFEPYFYATGSESILAENTYKFGFTGITAGGWLAHKLNKDYGMKTDYFEFGANKSNYFITNKDKRKEIFFYARPVTPRRGFEIGIMALDIFAKQRPEYKINLAGWNVSDYDIPFQYNNLSNLNISELNEVYNRCSVALVMSLTNMSLLPLELLASGVVPVVNDGPNNRMVSDNDYIEYCQNNPHALAERLISIVDKKNLEEHSRKASLSVGDCNWDASGKRFIGIFEEAMRNG